MTHNAPLTDDDDM